MLDQIGYPNFVTGAEVRHRQVDQFRQPRSRRQHQIEQVAVMSGQAKTSGFNVLIGYRLSPFLVGSQLRPIFNGGTAVRACHVATGISLLLTPHLKILRTRFVEALQNPRDQRDRLCFVEPVTRFKQALSPHCRTSAGNFVSLKR